MKGYHAYYNAKPGGRSGVAIFSKVNFISKKFKF